ncbi:Pls/PosA family non-ribosomal peptide synthetase [Agilicoccus flavus]|uniref:Pls/PosA family non-ribosomal peptide synthetase n=1 Tax=Agilicoccus flavus TaxID=2775968 RepID=UPI001CF6FC96|nr:Pls/PosA family non-ribosomal peptide synthetase [Agilicoccus flavus]
MHHYFEASCDRRPDATALEWEGGAATYRELDDEANHLANHLLSAGLPVGARVGLFFNRSYLMYVALLGAQKTGAAFVPIDPASPADRVEYFASDSGLDIVITTADLAGRLEDVDARMLVLDEELEVIRRSSGTRPQVPVEGDPTAYIIYTSGSSGRPKGVDVAQSSICNFLQVISEVYDVQPSDRVYQGMTISFDFAIEEVWPTWCVGATLVAGPTDGRRVGAGLTRFLEERAISLLYCVPTVLSTVERTIPSIRGLMVGGEACPAELVERWAPGRRMLNTYGPTEATVTCVWTRLLPGRAVTIGVPVPTYTAVILDDDRNPVPDGEVGELCIGGIGVARGYLNRPDLTADKFIAHPTDPHGGRIYRTGDLARVQEDGDIVYLGRADAEVKIRGHRVDLGEIESVMMRDPAVPTAAVKHLRSAEQGDELAGYVVVSPGENPDAVLARVHTAMRTSLPAYMVPTFMERIDEAPMLPSGKVDRKALPDPTTPRLIGGTGAVVAPDTAMETWVRSVWATVFGVDEDVLSVTADFFADLGGHSLSAANATSRLREDPRAASMSVVDLYAHPSVRALAEHLDLAAFASAEAPDGPLAQPVDRAARRPSTGRVAAFGAAQLAVVFIVVAIATLPFALLYWWYGGQPSSAMLQGIVLTFPLVYLAERWLLPLVVARLAGRDLQEGEHPLFGLVHLRVWLVGKAMELSPMSNLAGSAYAPGYLRLAGARIGQACHIGTAKVALPTLVDLGDDVTVGYATHLAGASLHDGVLRIGRVRIDDAATVAANCVLTGPCRVGERALLREQSSLAAGAALPSREAWQGAPAKRLPSVGEPILEIMASCDEAPRDWDRAHKERFALGLVALELAPLAAMLPVVALVWWALLASTELVAVVITALTGPVFVMSVCLLILALRRFGLPRTPVGIHHLRSRLGVEKWFADKLLEMSLQFTNTLYSTLYTPPWLRRLGARIGTRAEVSTIANIDPDLLTLGDESFVADMASVGSATYCNGHVAFRPTVVGRQSFVGNASFVPSGSHLADNSLLGVGSVPPTSGVRAGTSWLGNPPIYLPKREVFDEYTDEQTFRPARSRVVERYVIEALRICLPSSLLALSLFATLHVASVLGELGAPVLAMVFAVPAAAMVFGLTVVLVVAALKWILVGRYRPRVEPLWSRFVRRTEFVTGLYEAAAVPALLGLLTGTPLLGPVLRLFGVHVGRRSLLETTYLTEFDLVRLGDDVVIGPETSLQTHLFEDRVMKMGTIEVGDDVSTGTRSVVLYDTHVGRGADLAPLTLVMKGESLPPDTAWSGIPAQLSARSTAGGR